MGREILGKSDGVLRIGTDLKYAFIQRHRSVWPISLQCHVLGVSMAGYQEHFVRLASAAQRRHLNDGVAGAHQGHPCGNARRLRLATHLEGVACSWHSCGQKSRAKLMQLHCIRAKGKRRLKVPTDSNHNLPISRNLLNREVVVAEPYKVWEGDITYIATDEGWLFLAVVIDLFSRQVVG